MKFAISCPGQGILRQNLLLPFKNHHFLQKDIDTINNAMNYDFVLTLYNNKPELLTDTSVAQLAILSYTYLSTQLLKQAYGLDILCPSYILGHSLGEYSALLLSGILDLDSAIKLVYKRGLLMKSLVKDLSAKLSPELNSPFGMVAMMSKDISNIPPHLIANYNSPSQTVLSGKLSEIEKYTTSRSIKLSVNIPFHTSYLKPIIKDLGIDSFSKQRVPIISNLTGEPSVDSESTIHNTLQANYQPVQWVKSMNYLKLQNITKLINLGPGSVLSRLNKGYGIDNLDLDDIENSEQIDKLKELLK